MISLKNIIIKNIYHYKNGKEILNHGYVLNVEWKKPKYWHIHLQRYKSYVNWKLILHSSKEFYLSIGGIFHSDMDTQTNSWHDMHYNIVHDAFP